MTPDRIQSPPHAQTPMPTLREIIAILFRNWRAVVGGFLCLATLFVLSGRWIPRYEAQMKILVQRQRSDRVISPGSDTRSQIIDDQISDEDLNSEVELLGDEDLLRSVVLAINLKNRADGTPSQPSPAKISSAVRALRKALTIEGIHKTHIISVRYSSSDPQLAADVLKALANAYLAKHKAVHRPSGEISFFEQQTSQFHQDLEKAQQELTKFSQQTGIVSAPTERDAALEKSNEFAFDARKTSAEAIALETRIHAMEEQIRDLQPRMTTAVRTSDNPQLMEHLKSTLLDLQLKRTDLLTRFEPTYPLVQELDRKIAETQEALSRESTNPLRDETSDQNPAYQATQMELLKAKSDLSALKSRQQADESLAAQYRNMALHIDQNGVLQQNLLRNAKENEENYLLFVRKRAEATIDEQLDQRGILNVAIAQAPIVPALPTHSSVSIALLAFLLCSVGGLGVGFAADIMSSSFRTPGELAGYLGSPVLAALPAEKR